MKMEGVFSALKNNMVAMTAQMKKLEIISENIANAEKIAGKDGKVINKKVVVSQARQDRTQPAFSDQLHLKMRQTNAAHLRGPSGSTAGLTAVRENLPTVKVEEIVGSKLIYDPGNPGANEDGFVTMPDINVVEEMVDLVSASRVFEANVSVMSAAKKMAQQAMKI